jgi:hypothetical protein
MPFTPHIIEAGKFCANMSDFMSKPFKPLSMTDIIAAIPFRECIVSIEHTEQCNY